VAGALIGIALGAAVTTVLSDHIGFVVFGHSIEVGLDGSLLFLILLGAMAISIASSLVATAGATREGAVASIRGLGEDAESNEIAG
jgi:ABC-type lipoprotein release transport system permease subunit